MSASDAESPMEHETPESPFWKWLLIGLSFIAMIAFAAAHVPGRAAIVCRFAPMFGFVAGAVMGLITGQGRATRHRSRLASIAILSALGFVGLTLETHRLYKADLQKLLDSGAGPHLLPPKMIDNMQQARGEVVAARSKFDVYLRFRVSENRLFGKKILDAPWPAIIWAIEILIAAILAAVTYHVFTRPPRSPRERDSFNTAAGNEAG